MSGRVKKELARICRCIMSVAAAAMLRIARRGQAGSYRVYLLIISPVEAVRPGEPDRFTLYVSGGARRAINRFFGYFPSQTSPIEPALFRESHSSINTAVECTLDLEDKCITAKPASPTARKRVEWFEKSGLERPRRTFSLARDDLEAAPAVL